MAAICYVDTSALAKRYVAEAGSAAFDDFCQSEPGELVISPLVGTEFAGLLQRRVRASELSARYAVAARRRFQAEIGAGGWRLIPFEPVAFARAGELISTLGEALATLDSLHLACALLHGADALATADRQLAAAGRRAGLQVHQFG